MQKINIGSASKRIAGFKNADIRAGEDVDYTINLTEFPWTLSNNLIADNSIDAIWAEEVFEHLPFRVERKVFEEVYRVLKPTGWMFMTVPDIGKMNEYYYVSKFTDKQLICECMPHKESPQKPFKADPNCKNCKGESLINPMRFKMAYCGAQKHPWDTHQNMFFKEDLIKELTEIGFKDIQDNHNNLYKIKLKAFK